MVICLSVPFQPHTLGDMQAVRSTLAGFAEKRVVARLAVTEWDLQMRKRLQASLRRVRKPRSGGMIVKKQSLTAFGGAETEQSELYKKQNRGGCPCFVFSPLLFFNCVAVVLAKISLSLNSAAAAALYESVHFIDRHAVEVAFDCVFQA